ncbi:MAG: insulinase family protein [Alistipes sp.]|jgi:predicted Zn-dependent peptidase|nr:insulinase family protein [Alistipes sp.]
MKKQPEIVVPRSVSLPPIETVVLPDGLPVHIIQTAGQEVARVSLVWAAGSATQTKPFVASSTLNLLAEGSLGLSAHEIAEKLDFVGSYFDVNIDRDYAVATFCCLEKFFDPTLEMISEIVLRPAFPAEEVELYARKRMERLALERSKPATKAREMFSQALFGDNHPYGISSPEAKYLELTRDDVVAFWKEYYGAGNCFAVCSLGDSAAQRQAILSLLGQIPEREPRHNTRKEQFAIGKSDRYRFLEIPGAVQSAIRIGRILFPRNHPDFVGMQVVATLLGGYFGSRLIQNLREERGYTYGAMAAMVNLREAGYLAVSTEVAAEATSDAIEQIFNEMERLKTEPVDEEELTNVRRSMLGELMRILDGPFGIVDVVIENIQVSGGSEAQNYINHVIKEIENTTPERVRDLAIRYLRRDQFTTVVVGRE